MKRRDEQRVLGRPAHHIQRHDVVSAVTVEIGYQRILARERTAQTHRPSFPVAQCLGVAAKEALNGSMQSSVRGSGHSRTAVPCISAGRGTDQNHANLEDSHPEHSARRRDSPSPGYFLGHTCVSF
jgi:hypothetical protein